MDSITETVTVLRNAGWRIETKATPNSLVWLPPRYAPPPATVARFLANISECVAPGEQAWFLTETQYHGDTLGDVFAWNEWEKISLEAADGPQETRAVEAFWSRYLPLFIAVSPFYWYVACDLSPENFGRIVQGAEPEFEEVTEVADDFEQLLAKLRGHYESGATADLYIALLA